MTRTLGAAILGLCASVASMFLPIKNQPGLIADLEGDPFVGLALCSATCELYHHYIMFLAPLTATRATLRHCRFEHQCPVAINGVNEEHASNDRQAEQRADADSKPDNQATNTQAPVERVTAKNPQKVAADKAGAAARKAKHERLLKELRRVMESLHPGEATSGATVSGLGGDARRRSSAQQQSRPGLEASSDPMGHCFTCACGRCTRFRAFRCY